MATGALTQVEGIYKDLSYNRVKKMANMMNCLFVYRSLSSLCPPTTGSDWTTDGECFRSDGSDGYVQKAAILREIITHINTKRVVFLRRYSSSIGALVVLCFLFFFFLVVTIILRINGHTQRQKKASVLRIINGAGCSRERFWNK